MKLKNLLLLLPLLLVLPACNNNSSEGNSLSSDPSVEVQKKYTVKGTVIDKEEFSRIKGIDVSLISYSDETRVVSTDKKGEFEFTDVVEGEYYITVVSTDLYQRYEDFDIEVSGDEEIIKLDRIELTKNTTIWGDFY